MQQKEYRLDRLQLFLASPEGRLELKHIFPKAKEFSRTGLKRPKLTPRLLVSAGITTLLIASLLLIGLNLQLSWLMLLFWLLLIYLFIPFWAALGVMPTVVMAWYKVRRQLVKANRLFKKHKPMVIGIGGSYGKTSTKFLLKELLSQKYAVFSTPKSFNNAYSVAASVVQNYKGEELVIIEYGAYTVGEIAHLAKWLEPQLAIITGFTEQHLGLFGSLENSILAESELVEALPDDSIVFYNGADTGAEHIASIGAQGGQLKLRSYGLGKELTQPSSDAHGRLTVNYQGKSVATKLVGDHYLENLEGAIAAAKHLGVKDEDIVKAMESFEPSESFVRSYPHASGAWILDDGGTSNPEGFRAMEETAAGFKETQKILLFPGIVDLGDKSAEIHADLARLAKRHFSKVVYLGEDGREEFVRVLGRKIITDQDKALKLLKSLKKDSLLVIEGRMPSWVLEAL